jgi:transposase-like protein
VEWIDELAPGERKARIKRGTMVQFSEEQKKDAVIELCTREVSAAAVADRMGTSRGVLYKWKNEQLGKENKKAMKKSGKREIPDDKDDKMELDILKKATEIVKKAWASTSGI